jgi:cytochrome c oxidase cbb3-type subunit 3
MSDQPKQDRLLDHEYDGIQEYDNPMPRWWTFLFWVTIVFAALYWFNVPGIGVGKGRIVAYDREMAAAQ